MYALDAEALGIGGGGGGGRWGFWGCGLKRGIGCRVSKEG
jgi:hypothetical protein